MNQGGEVKGLDDEPGGFVWLTSSLTNQSEAVNHPAGDKDKTFRIEKVEEQIYKEPKNWEKRPFKQNEV